MIVVLLLSLVIALLLLLLSLLGLSLQPLSLVLEPISISVTPTDDAVLLAPAFGFRGERARGEAPLVPLALPFLALVGVTAVSLAGEEGCVENSAGLHIKQERQGRV